MKFIKNEIDEIKITEAIMKCWMQDFKEHLDIDVAIAGSGPSGLVAGYYLARENCKVAIFEKRLSIGGGMWGGGMMFNKCVFQEEAIPILDEFEIRYEEFLDTQEVKSQYSKPTIKKAYKSQVKANKKGNAQKSGDYIHAKTKYYIADAIETATKLAAKAIQAGVKIFNLMSVEDVIIRSEKIAGIVLNWTAVEMANLHVDPLSIKSKYLIDATGHDAEIAKIIVRKLGKKLFTKTGDLMGEKPMWSEVGEKDLIKNTKEIYHNLFVTGMASNTVFGSPRMGAIFGGMLMSGKKVAEIILRK